MTKDDGEQQRSSDPGERIRQYARIVLTIAERLANEPEVQGLLTRSDERATVSAGPEVEPQHLTNQQIP